MLLTYSYACRDYPGMEDCPGQFATATEAELWKVIELHASIAHGEDCGLWTEEERARLRSLIKTEVEIVTAA